MSYSQNLNRTIAYNYILIFFILCFPLKLIAKDFVIYDSIGQKNKPELIKFGLQPIKLAHTQFLWGKLSNKSLIDKNQINKFIATLDKDQNILCIDIEHWQLHSIETSTITNNLSKLEEIYSIFKEKLPNTKIGYYGIFPIRDYWSPVKNTPDKVEPWKANNLFISKTAMKMDIIFPSLYTFYNSPSDWEKYAIANLKEAKKYKKPAIAFLWPQFHGSNKIRGYEFIDETFWRFQLETAYKYADGIVIWMPAGDKRTTWDDTSKWWLETLDFISTKNLKN